MEQPLVSVITPCYNGEKYIHRLLDSVLKQTYKNIEFIFVNDGSTDKTQEIVLSYKEKFEKVGIKLIYIYQINKGQASALNEGLKVFKGEYLTWPDSDDILHTDNISKKVQFLEKNKDLGLVLCRIQCIDENDKLIKVLERKKKKQDNLFWDLIIEKNVFFAPGGYMIRSSAFLDVKPDRHIYESKSGQNWQMLLPITYKYKYGYINEILYYYIIRANSHSRHEVGLKELLKKTYIHEDTLKIVIKQMNISENDYYQKVIKTKYIKKRLFLAYVYKDRALLVNEYQKLQCYNSANKIDKMYYYFGKNKFLDVVFAFLIRVLRKLKRKLSK